MSSSAILAIDQGTTSTRFVIVDGKSNFVSIARKEHSQILPRPGWVEHNPEEILENTFSVISEALDHRYRLADGREVGDIDLWPLGISDSPVERLAGLRLDSAESFCNRLAGLQLMSLREALHYLHHPGPDVSLDALEDHSHPAWQRLKAYFARTLGDASAP